jgi:hypothetical protein
MKCLVAGRGRSHSAVCSQRALILAPVSLNGAGIHVPAATRIWAKGERVFGCEVAGPGGQNVCRLAGRTWDRFVHKKVSMSGSSGDGMPGRAGKPKSATIVRVDMTAL